MMSQIIKCTQVWKDVPDERLKYAQEMNEQTEEGQSDVSDDDIEDNGCLCFLSLLK